LKRKSLVTLIFTRLSVSLKKKTCGFKVKTTNSSIDLVQLATKGLEAIYKKDFHYKKAGVIVMDLTPTNQKQFTLFTTEKVKHQPLMTVVDKLNKSYGNNIVKFGSQSLGKQWKMKQERLSPRFSTNINEIITVKI
jgi:DNA polymerase V